MKYAPHRVNLDTFVGREAAVDQIGEMSARGESWSISAGRRLGKTMLLRFAERQFSVPPHLIVYVDKQELPDIGSAASFFGYVVAATWNRLASDERSQAPATIQDLAMLVSATAEDGRTWALLLDEGDALVKEPWGTSVLENLRWLVSNSPAAGRASVGLVGGMHLEDRVRSAGSSITNVCRPLFLEPLHRSEIDQLVHLGFPDSRGDLANATRAYSGGHPFLLQLFLSTVEIAGWPLPQEARLSLDGELARRVDGWLSDLSEGARAEAVRAAMRSDGVIRAESSELARGGLARTEGTTAVIASAALRQAILSAAPPTDVSTSTDAVVRPGYPYSNNRIFRSILSSARSDIRWVDNHAGPEVMDLLADAGLQGISIRVLSARRESADAARLRLRIRELRRELEVLGNTLAWREANSSDSMSLHDRYLLVDEDCYNIPPASSAAREKRSDIRVGSLSIEEFDSMWSRAATVAD